MNICPASVGGLILSTISIATRLKGISIRVSFPRILSARDLSSHFAETSQGGQYLATSPPYPSLKKLLLVLARLILSSLLLSWATDITYSFNELGRSTYFKLIFFFKVGSLVPSQRSPSDTHTSLYRRILFFKATINSTVSLHCRQRQ
ncbi:hypothetical protein PoB_001304100 [Plakobranchus ocellatus]|uniref:Uncharacterized protein n=1 Tax=Plakobranchus ocellatus TaxID=259542 RepID=A0AAV3YT10_9GAST|nr:hypothetical protein PoB_001304100 [Plakobranchus ocellatus]